MSEVLFIADVARALRTSVTTVRRMRRAGTFPIPELPSIDKRPRWSRAMVDRFLAGDGEGRRLLRRVG